MLPRRTWEIAMRIRQQSRGQAGAGRNEGRVPYRGTLAEMVYQLVGGCGPAWVLAAPSQFPELQQKARFIRISGAGLRESHVHDVIITREAPNYRLE